LRSSLLAIKPNVLRIMDEGQRAVVERVAAYMQQREDAFSSAMAAVTESVLEVANHQQCSTEDAKQQCLEFIDTDGMLDMAARTRVTGTAQLLGIEPGEYDADELRARVRQTFPVALILMRELLRKAVIGGINWSRSDRANSVWDLSLSFHASRAGTVDGVPVLLVTDDTLLLSAARTAGHGAFVETKEGYMAMLQAGGVSNRKEAMLEDAA
jgi:hypothetical protein